MAHGNTKLKKRNDFLGAWKSFKNLMGSLWEMINRNVRDTSFESNEGDLRKTAGSVLKMRPGGRFNV